MVWEFRCRVEVSWEWDLLMAHHLLQSNDSIPVDDELKIEGVAVEGEQPADGRSDLPILLDRGCFARGMKVVIQKRIVLLTLIAAYVVVSVDSVNMKVASVLEVEDQQLNVVEGDLTMGDVTMRMTPVARMKMRMIEQLPSSSGLNVVEFHHRLQTLNWTDDVGDQEVDHGDFQEVGHETTNEDDRRMTMRRSL